MHAEKNSSLCSTRLILVVVTTRRKLFSLFRFQFHFICIWFRRRCLTFSKNLKLFCVQICNKKILQLYKLSLSNRPQLHSASCWWTDSIQFTIKTRINSDLKTLIKPSYERWVWRWLSCRKKKKFNLRVQYHWLAIKSNSSNAHAN